MKKLDIVNVLAATSIANAMIKAHEEALSLAIEEANRVRDEAVAAAQEIHIAAMTAILDKVEDLNKIADFLGEVASAEEAVETAEKAVEEAFNQKNFEELAKLSKAVLKKKAAFEKVQAEYDACWGGIDEEIVNEFTPKPIEVLEVIEDKMDNLTEVVSKADSRAKDEKVVVWSSDNYNKVQVAPVKAKFVLPADARLPKDGDRVVLHRTNGQVAAAVYLEGAKKVSSLQMRLDKAAYTKAKALPEGEYTVGLAFKKDKSNNIAVDDNGIVWVTNFAKVEGK